MLLNGLSTLMDLRALGSLIDLGDFHGTIQNQTIATETKIAFCTFLLDLLKFSDCLHMFLE